MKKDFVSYKDIRNNGIELADKIYKDGFIPNIIYVCLRGGAYLGNIISEYFKFTKENKKVFYAAVVARSYRNQKQDENIVVDGWTYNPNLLDKDAKVLIVDDIFDSGLTLNTLYNLLIKEGLKKENVKIAVHDFKNYKYNPCKFDLVPHYYCRKHDIESEDKNKWIHYMTHELIGLTHEEAKQYEDAKILKILNKLKEIQIQNEKDR